METKTFEMDAMVAAEIVEPPHVEEERPPICPRCHKRLVILATQWSRDTAGKSIRRQLWGCPRGHATAYRANGAFTPLEMLPDVIG